MKTFAIITIIAGMYLFSSATGCFAQDSTVISLPAPRTEGGKPLMQALRERKSTRDFSTKKLSMQTLSDLLWAAFGVNRPEDSKRTAPSTRNRQEIGIYVVMEDGAYVYDAIANKLQCVVRKDLRKETGMQNFAAKAPLNLVYVADTPKMGKMDADETTLYISADVGFISQNVYLFCSSENLGTVVRGSLNRDALAKHLGLPTEKRIILAQTVGYPAETK